MVCLVDKKLHRQRELKYRAVPICEYQTRPNYIKHALNNNSKISRSNGKCG